MRHGERHVLDMQQRGSHACPPSIIHSSFVAKRLAGLLSTPTTAIHLSGWITMVILWLVIMAGSPRKGPSTSAELMKERLIFRDFSDWN